MIDLYTHYPRFVAAIKQDHVEQDAEHGHGFLHACEVANLGYIIADDE